jgi:hypothetical protein
MRVGGIAVEGEEASDVPEHDTLADQTYIHTMVKEGEKYVDQGSSELKMKLVGRDSDPPLREVPEDFLRTPAYGDPARSVWLSSPVEKPHEDKLVPEMHVIAQSDESHDFDQSGLQESLRTQEDKQSVDKGNEHQSHENRSLIRSRDVPGDTLWPAASSDPPAGHQTPQCGLDILPCGSWDENKQQPSLEVVDAEAVGLRKGVVVDDGWVGSGGHGDGEVRDLPGLVATEMHEVDEERGREGLDVEEEMVESEGELRSLVSEDYGSLQSKLARGPGEEWGDSRLLSLDDYRPWARRYGRVHVFVCLFVCMHRRAHTCMHACEHARIWIYRGHVRVYSRGCL